ncbi:MAG: hypothetical protein PWQ39_167 [Thermacetogenium sp.]|nr:hypothetical protein [Thermacetogenium sp.]
MKFPFPTTPNEAGGNPAIGFVSVLPGAGAATLACLAALSVAESGKRVALVDFSPAGKVRSYMGLTPDVCPASVLDAAGVSGPAEIQRAGVVHPRSVFVIPGAARPLDAPQVDSRLVSRTLTYLRREFDCAVAVLPPVWGAGWAGAIICDVICLVLRPDRADLDRCRDEVELLSRLGCGGRVKIVLNQSRAPGALRDEEVREVLRPDCVLPFDPAVRAMCNRRYLETGRFKKQVLSLFERGDGN